MGNQEGPEHLVSSSARGTPGGCTTTPVDRALLAKAGPCRSYLPLPEPPTERSHHKTGFYYREWLHPHLPELFLICLLHNKYNNILEEELCILPPRTPLSEHLGNIPHSLLCHPLSSSRGSRTDDSTKVPPVFKHHRLSPATSVCG